MRKHGRGGRWDILSFATAALMLTSAGVAYAETYEGSRGTKRYVGTPDSDRVELYAGNDTAFGRDGSYKLFGGPNNDKLYGEGGGNDTLYGHAGSDPLVGGPGEDHLFVASGNDTIFTGTSEEGDKETDEISCAAGPKDTVYLSGPKHSGTTSTAAART